MLPVPTLELDVDIHALDPVALQSLVFLHLLLERFCFSLELPRFFLEGLLLLCVLVGP